MISFLIGLVLAGVFGGWCFVTGLLIGNDTVEPALVTALGYVIILLSTCIYVAVFQ